MTATITRPKPKKAATKPQSPYKRLHVIIPIEDLLWASQQKPSVTQLWQECWTADPLWFSVDASNFCFGVQYFYLCEENSL
ncbi:hypothetical protein LC613_36440 [Nostoc sphaeroides CHAB 2801]|uniref:hypothetical protein n=1 Tax=Nostoc sphaeroides TaxID=446679 RepID=UPI001E2AB4B9|nr:hypothetical protein [Nostoc sphaeroides]MCC5633019.1 hypothetical protein [Nostoc sphaeroides CHAB 2801]